MLPFLIHFSLLSQCSCMRTICPEGHRNHLNMKDEELDAICQQCSFRKLCQHEAMRDWNSLPIMSCMNNCLCWTKFGRFSFNPPCVAICCPVACWWLLETWSVKNSIELRKEDTYLPNSGLNLSSYLKVTTKRSTFLRDKICARQKRIDMWQLLLLF